MLGKSTFGSGCDRQALVGDHPERTGCRTMTSEVPIGNLMKGGAEMLPFIVQSTFCAVGFTAVRCSRSSSTCTGPSRLHAVVSRGYDALASRQALLDLRHAPSIRPTLTLPQLGRGRGRDDISVKPVGAALHRCVGHHHHILQGLHQQPRGHRKARPQSIIRIVEARLPAGLVPLAGSTWLSSSLSVPSASSFPSIRAVGRHLQRTGLEASLMAGSCCSAR